MTDYSKETKKQLSKKEKEFYNQRTVSAYTERDHLISADAESDDALRKQAEFLKTFRPEIQSKIPKTFAFYGSAIQYYRDAAYNIINYYPFDGTWEEVLDWYSQSPQIDMALLKQFWPRQVGHVSFQSSEYITFYAGPQSISEHEFLSSPTHGETALKLDGVKGNTVEFWLKKDNLFEGISETILHVGSHPGKLSNDQSAELKISLLGTSGNPFHLTFKSGSEGVENFQLSTDKVGLTSETVADGEWHHYAFRIHSDDSEIVVKTYVDGELDSQTVEQVNATIGSVDSYMAGRIGANLEDSSGNLRGSIDSFRFWKGLRTAKEISKFHDKKIYASPTKERDYSSRLGVSYTFNKEKIGNTAVDSLIIDSSGNDVTGRIVNYRDSSRSDLSAINYYKGSNNKEIGDPILDPQNNRVIALLEELEQIAKSYDSQNGNKLISKLPFWASEYKDKGSNSKELDFLLHAIATEFDSVKMKLDAIRKLSTPSFVDTHFVSDPDQENTSANPEALQLNVSYYKSDTKNLDSGISVENEIDFSKRSIKDLGYDPGSIELLSQTTPSEETDSIIRGILMGSSQAENRAMLYRTLENTLIYSLKRKGTENSFSALLNTLGLGRSVISQNLRGTAAELQITNKKVDNTFLKLKSLSFQDNNSETLFLKQDTSESRSNIPGSNVQSEYTFEGTFIFPAKKGIAHSILSSNVFGLAEHNAAATNAADFQIYVEKKSPESSEARFVLRSESGLIPEQKTAFFPEVYDNQAWNLALKFEKSVDNKFLEYESPKYKIKLLGNSYIGSVLVDTFVLELDLSEQIYNNFNNCDKTVFIGAHRQDLTGTLLQASDVKFVDFNGWDISLTEQEISLRAQNANFKGSKKILENRKLSYKNDTFAKNLIFRISPIAISSFESNGKIVLKDQSGGSEDLIGRYGSLLGSQYNFETTVFTNKIENAIQQEFLPAQENVPIENLAGSDSVAIKDHDLKKFDIESRPNLKILSFEKSLYRSVSKKMLEFLGGVNSYNNVIGEPVNKYRKNYKLLDHLRYLFYENVTNENQFERFVQYYRWIDKAIGGFLEQMIPASTLSNTGIENVVESHALERNKYQHKLMRLEEKVPKLHGNLLSINELLYDWEHGHAPIEILFRDDFSYAVNEQQLSNWSSNEDGRPAEPTWIGPTVVSHSTTGNKVLALKGQRSVSAPAVDDSDPPAADRPPGADGFYRWVSPKTSFSKPVLVQFGVYEGTGTTNYPAADDPYGLGAPRAIYDEHFYLQYKVGVNGSWTTIMTFEAGTGFDLSTVQEKYISKGQTAEKPLFLRWISTISQTFDNFHWAIDNVSVVNVGENENCLWYKDRKEKEQEREALRIVLTTVAEGDNSAQNFRRYALRNLPRPYKHTITRQDSFSMGSNHKSNKIKEFYKIVNEGKTIEIKSDNFYESISCNDKIDPTVKEKWTAATDVTSTFGYLDGDGSLLLPLTFYKTTAGSNFENFRSEIQISNNLEEEIPSLQSPFVRDLVGGMPHRRVKLGTPKDDRPEAYHIESTEDSIIISKSKNQSSMFYKNLGSSRFYNIANVKQKLFEDEVLVFGNYVKDYEIVHTSGRSINNTFLVETEGLGLTGTQQISHYVSGTTDFEDPQRTRREHVFVTRFTPAGSPVSEAAFGKDKVSGEFSVYNTVNYRNPIIRDVYNHLSHEMSEKFGFRSGSTVQASIHKTQRNYNRFTGSLGKEKQADNYYVTHQIPQNDFGYSWITASANEDVYSFLNKNANFGHQHNFEISGSLKSSETISFLGQGQTPVITGIRNGDEVYWFGEQVDPYGVGDPAYVSENISFCNLNSVLVDKVDPENNTMGWPSYYPTNEVEFHDSVELISSLGWPFLNAFRFKKEEFNSVNFAQPYRYTGILNHLILNRQGPYGWPTWKQIRGHQHPIVESHKKNNTMSFVFRGDEPMAKSLNKYKQRTGFEFPLEPEVQTSRTIINFKEIRATNRFLPINFSTHFIPDSGADFARPNEGQFLRGSAIQTTQYKSWFYDNFYDSLMIDTEGRALEADLMNSLSKRFTIQNDISGFANQSMATDILFREQKFHSHKSLKKMLLLHERMKDQLNFDTVMREFNYTEKLFPSEENTYTKNVRTREKFNFFGWNKYRKDRELISEINNFITGTAKLYVDNNNVIHVFFPEIEKTNKTEGPFFNYKEQFIQSIDAVDLHNTGGLNVYGLSNRAFNYPVLNAAGPRTIITSSVWVLDSRKDYSSRPISITSSFFTEGPAFMKTREQGTRGEGILQNDYSIFALGNNCLHGAPPGAPLYNRRIPQDYENDSFLAGEALYETANDHPIGPCFENYSDFSTETKFVGQDYSLLPEFTISRFTEDVVNRILGEEGTLTPEEATRLYDNLFEVVGAIYHTSSNQLTIGSQFFNTYSTSDFMKYFTDFREILEQEDKTIRPHKINLRCQAVKKFLPKRGFYPAERTVQISEIFNRSYLSKPGIHYDDPRLNVPVAESLHPFVSTIENGGGYTTEEQVFAMLEKRIANSRAQALKVLMGPGVLHNSIKAGLAVDYPLFKEQTNGLVALTAIFQHAIDNGVENSIRTPFPNTALSYMTGSDLNQTRDAGIPRIKEDVYKRIQFEDLLKPERLFDCVIQDNEPHPSASLYYGSSQHFAALERPTNFGNVRFTIDFIGDGTGLFPLQTDITRFMVGMEPYKLAINNFAAETVNFFLEDGKITSATSEPVHPYLEDDVTYEMYVALGNTGISMYDRHSAFGPPVDEGSPKMTEFSHNTEVIPARAPSAGTIRFQTNRSQSLNTLSFHSTHFENDCEGGGNTLRVEPGSSYEPAAYLTASNYYDHGHHQYYFAVTGSSKKVVNYFYDSRCYTGSVLTIDFQDFNQMTSGFTQRYAYNAPNNLLSATNSGVGVVYGNHGHAVPGVQLSIVPDNITTWVANVVDNNVLVDKELMPRYHVGFYDSVESKNLTNLESPTVTEALTGSDGAVAVFILQGSTTIPYIDIRDPNDSNQFKTPEQIAEQFATLFLSNSAGWDAAVGSTVSLDALPTSQLTGRIDDRFSVVKNGSRVSIFHKRNKYDNSFFTFHTGAVDRWYSADAQGAILDNDNFIATGSGPSNVALAEISTNSLSPSGLGAKQIGLQVYAPSVGIFVPDVTTGLKAEAAVHNSTVYNGTTNGTYNNNQSPIQNTYIQYVDIKNAKRIDQAFGSGFQTVSETLLEQLVEDEWSLFLASNAIQADLNLEIAKDTEGTIDYLRIERTDPGASGNQDILFPAGMVSEQTWINPGGLNALGAILPGRDEERIPEPIAVTSSFNATNSHGFLPYVPPYLDPSSLGYAKIFFTPYDGSRSYTPREVIDAVFQPTEHDDQGNVLPLRHPGCGIEFVNGQTPSNPDDNCNFQNAMSISASLSMAETVTLMEDNMNVSSQNDVKSRWVIRTKWETPILDFSNAEVTSLNLQDNSLTKTTGSPWKTRYQSNYYHLQPSSSIPYLTSSTGMWHQKGSIPRKALGYFLSITGPDEVPGTRREKTDSFVYGKGNLATKFGFIAGDKRPEGDKFSFNTPEVSYSSLGQIENKKVIHEAIVAIPFIVQELGSRPDVPGQQGTRMEYFYLNPDLAVDAKSVNNVAKTDFERRLRSARDPEVRKAIHKRYDRWFDAPSSDATLSLAYQYRMLEKYIFPPHMDFNQVETLPPFLFYVFQFKSTIRQKHLADLWQNTYPEDNTSGTIFQSQHSRISPTEFDIEQKVEDFDTEFLTTFLDTQSLKYTDGELVHESPLMHVDKFVKSNVRWLIFKVKYRGHSDYDQFVKKCVAGRENNIHRWNGLRVSDGKTQVKTGVQFNWPYDFFSTIELAKLEAKVDFYSELEIERIEIQRTSPVPDIQISNTDAVVVDNGVSLSTAQFAQEYQLQTYPYSSSEQQMNSDEVPQYTIIGGSSSSLASASVLVVRQELKSDTDPAAQSYTIAVSQGYSLQAGSEQLFLNGLLQTPGAQNDYTISGTTVTLMSTIQSTDSIYVTYLKDPDN